MCIRDRPRATTDMKFVDPVFNPGAVIDVPDVHLLYALFGLVALIDLCNFFAALGVTLCINIMRKLACIRRGFQHMAFSNISAWKPYKAALDPEQCTSWPADNNRKAADTRRIIFVRHGESQWNMLFNSGLAGGKTLYRLLMYPILEALKFPMRDSYYYDSPLSELGIDQCLELSNYLSNPPLDPDVVPGAKPTGRERDAADLRGDANTRSIVVCSQLRRAAATCAIGLWPRLKATGEKVLLLSSLMEQSRNVDCVPLSAPQEVPPLNDVKATLNDPSFGEDRFDACGNMGDKPVRAQGKKGFDRITNFVEFCFQEELEKTTVIAVGHSLYFKRFFNCFLPHGFNSVSKNCKLKNAGAVGLTLQRKVENGKTFYRIHPDEIIEVHGGFKR
eukprot:TRINITY_DN13436_c0_g1_i2.p1 TRINITY_DN13436_c0_g1~~TRINITY_DN13436_c0_g1_i2.p1  ORF type:complete len:390 (-),score=98.19 TRINITY_DN13436_c0_g1_i2:207-1376(-)